MSPTVSTWVNIVLAVLGFLVGATAQLTPIFGANVTTEIISVSGLAVGVVSAINAGLHSISTPVAGPVLKFFKRGA